MNLIADQERSKLKIAVLYDDEFILHNTGPNHPENPDRLSSTVSTLVVTSRQAGRGSRDDLVNHKNMANYKRK